MATDKDNIEKSVKEIAVEAIELAKDYRHEFVTLEHVLKVLLTKDKVHDYFKTSALDINKVSSDVDAFLEGGFLETVTTADQKWNPFKHKHFEVLFTRSVAQMLVFQPAKVDVALSVLITMFQTAAADETPAMAALENNRVTLESLKKHIGKVYGGRENAHGEMVSENEPRTPEEGALYLEKYCENLNNSAKNGRIDPLIGRIGEVDQIIKITARRRKNNAVMVGNPGVGKTAVVEGLAHSIVAGEVPDIIKECIVYSLDIGALVAGTRFRGDFEERMKNILVSMKLIGNGILFIDEIHMIMGAGGAGKGDMDVANLLKPALAKGELRCIGSTTQEEFRQNFEKDRALMRRFKKVQIDEPSIELTKQILRGLRTVYSEFHGVEYSDEALDAAVDLTAKYIHNQVLPDKAIDIIDAAGATQRVQPAETKLKIINIQQVEEEISKVVHIPAQEVADDEASKLERLHTDLHKKVYGQAKAIELLVDSILVARAGLRDVTKPSGCYLLVGPSGVGKTEICKQISSTMGIPLIRFDMSEYMEKHSVSKFIGSPPGYVGYGDGGAGSGMLINAVDSSPVCVLLLDEIEKAHPDVLNILLQVMDNGKLSSSFGKEVSFRNVILVMTSNAGAAALEKNAIGFGKINKQETMNDDAVKRMFTPEFRNRLDAIIPFNRLEPEVMASIVDKFISELNVRSSDRNVTVEIDELAKSWLAEKGFDRNMGARPLGRVISENISKPLSKMMLFGELKNGGIAKVSVAEDKIILNV